MHLWPICQITFNWLTTNAFMLLLLLMIMLIIQVTMLECLLQQRDAVCHAVISSSSRNSRDVQNLSPEQWTTASQLMSTLRPFVEIVDLMSTMSFPPLSLIVPAVDGLRRALCELTDGHDGLRDVLLDLINENFGAVFDDDELCAATVVGVFVC